MIIDIHAHPVLLDVLRPPKILVFVNGSLGVFGQDTNPC